jgi:large subunit ribosomal protein L16
VILLCLFADFEVLLFINNDFSTFQVKPILELVAHKLPFAAKVVSQQMMEEMTKEEERLERENLNRYTFKYVVQNNLGGCHNWISPYDKQWFGKYV